VTRLVGRALYVIVAVVVCPLVTNVAVAAPIAPSRASERLRRTEFVRQM
jgi:hypothetical protein